MQLWSERKIARDSEGRYSIEHGFFAYPYFVTDPLVEKIRHEPQFSQLLNIARDRHAAFKSRFF